MLEIQNSTQIHQAKTAWFLYGAPGAGKTRGAASFPRPLFLVPANENSQLTLKQLAGKFDFILVGKKADGTPVPVRKHLDEILAGLEKQHKLMWDALDRAASAADDAAREAAEIEAERVFPWQTVVLESLTHLGDLLVDDVGEMGRRKMDQQGWGLISTYLRTVHSRLRNMDVHVVYTALSKVLQDDDGGMVAGGPNIIGSMAEKLPAACDSVIYMEELPAGKDGRPVYRAYFRKYKKWLARTRFGTLPDFMDSFDFGKLQF